MKSKKTLALVMALAMCLTAIALPASAAGGLVLSVEKTNFAPGEKFETTVSGITAENNRGNIIAVALCRPDDPYHGEIYSYDGADGREYLWHRGTGPTASRTFTAPKLEGAWELRLFSDAEAKPPVYHSKVAITVGGGGTAEPPKPQVQAVTAQPTASTVYIDGRAVAFEAYTIAGSNYFKLRDLAYALGGTPKQFAVGYDEATKAVTLTSGGAYTAVGSEMQKGDGKPKTASPTQSKIYLDGRELSLTVYTIGGSNFFKLRDLMEVLNVYVGYDEPTRAITLDTARGYGQTDKPTDPPPNSGFSIVGMWRHTGAYNNACQIFYADGSVIHIGLRDNLTSGGYIVITVTLAKYKITGNSIEIYDVVGFTLNSLNVSKNNQRQFVQDYLKMVKIVNAGSRAEVEALTDTTNDLYNTFGNPSFSPHVHYETVSEFSIVDSNSFATTWPNDAQWVLVRVQE